MKKIISVIVFNITLFLSAANAQNGQIHILSVNDMHAAIDRFPQFTIIVDSLRAAYPDLLLLSAGDNRTGNPANDMNPVSSYPMTALMNYTGFNYSAIGNHEFDGGIDGLRTVINNSYCHYLCANMYAPDSLRLHIEPFALVDRNGVRIGILSLVQTGDQTGIPDAHPKQVGTAKFRPLIDVAREYAWMRNECNVFVLLTHDGFEEDLKLADIMPEADIIIGGHSHTKIDPYRMENNVMITQTERYLKYASFITIDVKDGKVTNRNTELIDVRNFPKSDAKVQAIVDSFSNNPELHRVLTQATADFTDKEQLGCLMADALRIELGADIAIQNSGGVRYETKSKGDFTVDDVYRLDPFGNEVIEYNLTGEEVVRLLTAISRAEDYGPAYVSGIRYKIHLGDSNRDVKSVKITMPDGSKFDLKRTYKVVMNSYIAVIADYEKSDEGRNLFLIAADLLIQYLDKQPSIDYTGVSNLEVEMDKQISR